MKFSTVLGLASMVTGITASATPAKRDIQDILGVFSDISDSVDTLNSDIGAYSGSVDTIQSDSDDLLSIIKDGTTTISGSSMLSSTDALKLQAPVQALQKKIEGVVDSLISIKSDLVSDGFGERVESTLVDQQTAAEALSKAVVSKVPASLQGIATQLAAGISKALAKGVAAFKGTGGGSSSTTSSSETTTSTGGSTTTTGGSYTTSTPPPYTTSSTETTATGTGGYTPTTPPTGSPIPSNVAALKAVSGAVGGVAIFAAMLGL